MRSRTSIIWKPSKDEFAAIAKESKTMGEFLGKFGMANKGGNSKTIRKRIEEECVDLSHFEAPLTTQLRCLSISRVKATIDNDKVFIENSPIARRVVRNKVIKQNLIEYKCSECDMGNVWNGRAITLQLDHINGVSNDHRLENLRWLCPNCHSQTPTFAGRSNKGKIRKIKTISTCAECGQPKHDNISKLCVNCSSIKRRKCNRPNIEELQQLLQNNSFVSVGKMFGVSDNAIRKWIKTPPT